MSGGEVKSYDDLEVWRLGMDMAQFAYETTRGFPPEERFGLTSQIRRAGVSIPANIAEGWGRGKTSAQINFVRISRGSLYELKTHMALAARLGYLEAEAAALFDVAAAKLGRKLNAYLSVLEDGVVRETAVEYGVDRDATADGSRL